MRFLFLHPLGRLFLLVTLLLNIDQPLCAQSPAWQWATSPGTGAGTSTTTDAAGNVYMVGWFAGTATFGATTLIDAGFTDLFVAKLSPTGAWQWATRVGGISDEYGTDVAVDSSGNVVVTGIFRSPTLSCGTTTLSNPGGDLSLFVAKLSPTGAWQWASSAQGNIEDHGTDVAIDGSGNVVVTGSFTSSTLSCGTTTLTNAGLSKDFFVAKLSPTGAWQWATRAGGISDDYCTGVAVDGSGDIVVTGNFTSPTLSCGATTLTNVGPSSDFFVAKLSPTGTWQWATGAGGYSDDYGTGLVIDGSGDIVITGNFTSPTLSCGATTLITSNANARDLFVAKLSPTGAWQWASSAGGYSTSLGVAADRSGNAVVTGWFIGPTISFGTTSLNNTSSWQADLFVAKISPTGAWHWATSASRIGSGNGYELSGGLASDGSGNVIVTGTFTSPRLSFGANTLVNPNLISTIFVAYLGTLTGLPNVPAQSPYTICPNPTRSIVQLTGASGSTATLLDALGRPVASASISPTGTAILDVRTLPAGLYLLHTATATRRLVIE